MKQQGTTLPANNHTLKQYAFFCRDVVVPEKAKMEKRNE
ncbi:crotonobetainyl CoA hydratase [Escherichia coli S17]|nr:crotonobetainyl CoA hydratase [Escherichia coli S17]